MKFEPLFRETILSEKLAKDFPPKIFNSNKKFLFSICCPENCKHNGEVTVSRWKAIIPKGDENLIPKFKNMDESNKIFQDAFTYDFQDPQPNTVQWWVNFADRNLFLAYGGGLFAQDEIQVAEHPILASVKEFLNFKRNEDKKYCPFTVQDNEPTPILISGAERKVKVSLDKNESEGRKNGLYGNVFMSSSQEAIKNATKVLNPPTISNFIAIEAIPGGCGRYKKEEIKFTLTTAFTGFRAAVEESKRLKNDKAYCVIHTGNWGTGAYGGNKELMPLLQIIAARLAQVDLLVYHSFAPEFTGAYNKARNILDGLTANSSSITLDALIDKIYAVGFEWGFSDGN